MHLRPPPPPSHHHNHRSTLRPEHAFSLLDEHAGQVLTTGKYLHVIRECGQTTTSSLSPSPSSALTATVVEEEEEEEAGAGGKKKLRCAAGKAALGEAIEAAYRRACGLLLDLVLQRHQLLPRLVRAVVLTTDVCVWVVVGLGCIHID